MGKIYFNLNSKEISFLEEHEKNEYDVLLSSMARKIVLASLNNVKMFDVMDIQKKNGPEIQHLIKNGYRPVNKDMELFITQNYEFCPHCGEDIDINAVTNTIIYDVGRDLSNITKKNYYPCKELACGNCGAVSLFYYNVYSNKEDRTRFIREFSPKGVTIFIRFRYEIDDKRNAEVPILFEFRQFMKFFNKVKKRESLSNFETKECKTEDLLESLNTESSFKLVSMLFDEGLHKLLETDEDKLVGNINVVVNPIRLGSYSKYASFEDFELIKSFEKIFKDRAKFIQYLCKPPQFFFTK